MSGGSNKVAIWVGMFLGSALGGWIPVLLGADTISFASIIGSVVGGFGGIALGYFVASRYF